MSFISDYLRVARSKVSLQIRPAIITNAIFIIRNSVCHSVEVQSSALPYSAFYFSPRIFKLFDHKHDGVIDFQEFVRSLSVFHPAAAPDEKAVCM